MNFKGIGGTSTASSSTGLSFNFGGTTTAKTTANAGFSLGGSNLFSSQSTLASAAPKSTAAGLSLFSSPSLNTTSATATTQPATLSLGGNKENTNPSKEGNKLTTATNVKDEAVPDIICKDIQSFKGFTKKQLEDSNEVAKFSVQSLNKITKEANALSSALAAVSSALQNNKGSVLKLREEFATELENAGMVRRMMLSMQHDDMAPMKYFFDLVCSFERNMQLYQKQIDELEKHLHSITNPAAFSYQDISTTLCKMQETYVGLASNLHSIHEKVKTAKEQYLTYRKVVHGDNVNPFAPKKSGPFEVKSRGPSHAAGSMSNVATLAMATVMQQQQPQIQPQQTKPSGFATLGSAFGSNPTTTNLFGSSSTAGSSLFGGSTSNPTTTSSGGFSFGNTSALKPTLSAAPSRTVSSLLGRKVSVNLQSRLSSTTASTSFRPVPPGSKARRAAILSSVTPRSTAARE